MKPISLNLASYQSAVNLKLASYQLEADILS